MQVTKSLHGLGTHCLAQNDWMLLVFANIWCVFQPVFMTHDWHAETYRKACEDCPCSMSGAGVSANDSNILRQTVHTISGKRLKIISGQRLQHPFTPSQMLLGHFGLHSVLDTLGSRKHGIWAPVAE